MTLKLDAKKKNNQPTNQPFARLITGSSTYCKAAGRIPASLAFKATGVHSCWPPMQGRLIAGDEASVAKGNGRSRCRRVMND